MNLARRSVLKILGGIAALPVLRRTAWAEHTAVRALQFKVVGPREYVLGIPSTAIAGGSRAALTVSAPADFRPRRLIIPGMWGEHFMLEDVFIGGVPQLATGHRLDEEWLPGYGEGPPKELPREVEGYPATIFSETGPLGDNPLTMSVCAKDRYITLIVRNTAPTARNFTAAVIGNELVATPLGPAWKVHPALSPEVERLHARIAERESAEDDGNMAAVLAADMRAFAQEEGFELGEISIEKGVAIGRPPRRGLFARLFRRRQA